MTHGTTEVDLTVCDREPIHIPGSIQPHGLLLAASPRGLRVQVVSANAAHFLGLQPDDVLDRPLGELLRGPALDLLERRPAEARLSEESPLAATIITPDASGTATGLEATAMLHASGGLLVVELEPLANHGAEDMHTAPTSLASTLSIRLERAPDVPQLLEVLVSGIKRLTGFQRVMAYVFDHDDSGEVVAEAVDRGVESFLGLRYPASDIPKQARALYTRSWLRLIGDVTYTPAPLVPERNPLTGAPLDLSDSVLRSVSPVHVQYLQNMGVTSSMSISLVVGGELYGLVACHHEQAPHFIDFATRRACEFIGRTASLMIEARTARATLEAARAKEPLLERLQQAIAAEAPATPVVEALMADNTALDLLNASGMAHVQERAILVRGTTPGEATLLRIVAWLQEHVKGPHYHSHEFCREMTADTTTDAIATDLHHGCGLLAIRLAGPGEWLCFFRSETLRTVSWAGDPEKAAHQPTLRESAELSQEGPDPIKRLAPRASFAAWQQTVRDTSTPWKPEELEATDRLRVLLLSAQARRAHDRLAHVNRELTRKNSELDSFATVVAHDLKEPLRGIDFHARTLARDYRLVPLDTGKDGANRADEAKGAEKLTRIHDLAVNARALITEFSEYNKLDHTTLRRREVDMNLLVAQAGDVVAEAYEAAGVELVVAPDLPPATCDPHRVREVFANLLSNAAKYCVRDERPCRVEVGAATDEHGETAWYVRDQGIGIPQDKQEMIFRLFKRLHPKDTYGGGTGTGLAIVRRVVERHGGRIWVESAPGEGSTFYLTLSGS